MNLDNNFKTICIAIAISSVLLLLAGMSIVSVLFLSAALYITYEWFQAKTKYDALKQKYSHIEDVEASFLAAHNELVALNTKIDSLNITHSELQDRVSFINEVVDFNEMGVYEPVFSFSDSDGYKEKIKEVRLKQKEMIRNKTAFRCDTDWAIGSNASEGARIIEQTIKLTARAFNNEVDAAIGNVSWSNIDRMADRIRKAFASINKVNEKSQVTISQHYLDLKLKELFLTYEVKEKLNTEKEAQNEIRRQQKEEQKVNQEYAAALEEEEKLQQLLTTIQEKAAHSAGAELQALQNQVATLGQELKDIQKKNDRVKAMAQQTKIGYVYIISNIGSFGENVYKIGMTRRLDPMDRIKELGSASVPFYFDVHAMIFSEDAPALESQIQNIFSSHRVNKLNHRKEFFNIPLSDIKSKIQDINPNVSFIDNVEAREYRESLALSRRATA